MKVELKRDFYDYNGSLQKKGVVELENDYVIWSQEAEDAARKNEVAHKDDKSFVPVKFLPNDAVVITDKPPAPKSPTELKAEKIAAAQTALDEAEKAAADAKTDDEKKTATAVLDSARKTLAEAKK